MTRRQIGWLVAIVVLLLTFVGVSFGIYKYGRDDTTSGIGTSVTTSAPPVIVLAPSTVPVPTAQTVPGLPMGCIMPNVVGTLAAPAWLSDGSDYVIQMTYQGTQRRLPLSTWASHKVKMSSLRSQWEAICPAGTSALNPFPTPKPQPAPKPAPSATVSPELPTYYSYQYTTFDDLAQLGVPKGTYCKHMLMWGWRFPEVNSWYLEHGAPSHMDADGNGIPCETIYPPYTS